MKKLYYTSVTLLLILASLFNVYIFAFQIPKIENYALDEYEIFDIDSKSKQDVKATEPYAKKGVFGWSKDFDFVKTVKIEDKTYFMPTKKFREGGYGDANSNFFSKTSIWCENVEKEFAGETQTIPWDRVGFDVNGNITYINLDVNTEIKTLDDPRKETEALAKEYFEKYIDRIGAAVDDNSEYKCYFKRRGRLDTNNIDAECFTIYEGYNDTEYDQVALNSAGYFHFDPVAVRDYYQYNFVKFVNGKATSEEITVKVYENGELYQILADFQCILSEDVISYDEAKVNALSTDYVRKYYEKRYADNPEKQITDLRVSKNLPYKDALGRRGVKSCVVIDFENGTQTYHSKIVLFEGVNYTVRYHVATFVIIEAAMVLGTVVWIIRSITMRNRNRYIRSRCLHNRTY